MHMSNKGRINLAPQIAMIVDRIGYEYNLTVDDLTNKKRPDHVIWPRHLAMHLCYEAGHSYRTISAFFNRTNNSLTYVNREVARMCAEMPDLQKHRIRLGRELGINV